MTDFVDVGAARLEYADVPASRIGLPALLLLHEGLGSVSMWRDFPAQLAESTGCRIVAYSRAGFGRSSPRTSPYTPRFIHEEAFEVIPALRAQLGIDPVVLVGHSTGASMALVHASAQGLPVAGVVAMAPLTTVEGSNVESIERAGTLYRTTGGDSPIRERIGAHGRGSLWRRTQSTMAGSVRRRAPLPTTRPT